MGRLWDTRKIMTRIMTRVKTILSGLSVIFLGSLMGVIVVSALFWVAPKVEAKILPVVENFAITTVTQNEAGLELYGYFDKIRECNLNEFSVYTILEDGTVKNIPVYRPTYIGDASDSFPDKRPTGHNAFGPWIIYKQAVPEESTFQIYIIYEYSCIPLWDTITTLGPFEISH